MTDNQQKTPSSSRQATTLTAVKIIGVVGGIALAIYLLEVLLMIFAGILLAVLLDGLTRLVKNITHLPRGWCLPIVGVLILGPILLVAWLFGPTFLQQVGDLTDRLPEALSSLEQSVRNTETGNKILSALPDPEELVAEPGRFLGGIAGVFSGALSTIAGIILVLFVGLYGAISPHTYTNAFLHLFPEKRRERMRELITTQGRVLRRWLIGRFSTMAVVGILMGTSFWLIGLPMAGTLGVLAAILSFIPYLGPILAVIPTTLVALVHGPSTILYVWLIHAVVETLEGNIISPLIQLEAVSLPPAVLISVQIIMGILAGAVGVLLATPLAVVVIVTVQILYVHDVLNDKVKILGES